MEKCRTACKFGGENETLAPCTALKKGEEKRTGLGINRVATSGAWTPSWVGSLGGGVRLTRACVFVGTTPKRSAWVTNGWTCDFNLDQFHSPEARAVSSEQIRSSADYADLRRFEFAVSSAGRRSTRFVNYEITSRITLPETSVSRKSRPLWR